MTVPEKANLFYLTQPAPGVFMPNIQIGETFQRVEITKAQLANVLVDGAAMALREIEPA